MARTPSPTRVALRHLATVPGSKEDLIEAADAVLELIEGWGYPRYSRFYDDAAPVHDELLQYRSWTRDRDIPEYVRDALGDAIGKTQHEAPDWKGAVERLHEALTTWKRQLGRMLTASNDEWEPPTLPEIKRSLGRVGFRKLRVEANQTRDGVTFHIHFAPFFSGVKMTPGSLRISGREDTKIKNRILDVFDDEFRLDPYGLRLVEMRELGDPGDETKVEATYTISVDL